MKTYPHTLWKKEVTSFAHINLKSKQKKLASFKKPNNFEAKLFKGET